MSLVAKFGQVADDNADIEVNCLSTDEVGDLVCVSGDISSARWTVSKSDCFDETKMPAVGIITKKESSTVATMRRVGRIDVFTGIDVTKHYFVGESGGLQEGPPSASGAGHYAVVQKIGIPVDSDVLWLTGEIGHLIKLVGY